MESVNVQDDSRATPAGVYMDARIRELILTLAAPRAGERLLDIGCGRGDYLALFREKGCDVTGIDSSPVRLDLARRRLGHRAELRQGRVDDLPFSDNVFDLATLITSLEFTDDPGRAIAEAIRVSRDRVFVGIMNRWSLIGAQGRLSSLFPPPPGCRPHPLSLASLSAMVRNQLPGVALHWGSVLFLPWGLYTFGAGLEERIPLLKNPLGAFLGLVFPVTVSLLTIQEVIREPEPIASNGRTPVPGVVRGSNTVRFRTAVRRSAGRGTERGS
jgi:SAM-dependent methyltransferase